MDGLVTNSFHFVERGLRDVFPLQDSERRFLKGGPICYPYMSYP
jgi:hypothetical protein